MLDKRTLLAIRTAIEPADGIGSFVYTGPNACSIGLLRRMFGYNIRQFDELTCSYVESYTEAWNGLGRNDDAPPFFAGCDEDNGYNFPEAKLRRKIRVLKYINDQLAIIAEHEALESPMRELIVV